MSNLVKALIMVSYMRSLLDNWSLDESSKHLLLLKRRIRMFMQSRQRTNPKDYMLAIEIGNIAWVNVINKYKKDRVPIEGVHTILYLFNKNEAILTKFANISDKLIESFSFTHYQGDCEYEIEKNAAKVAADLIEYTQKAFEGLNDERD